MGKLFKLALEEAVVEEPSIVEDVPVEEAVANAEELAKTDSEIQQDIAAVEELVEEKTKLEEQAMTNDELLSNPDAVVTATDVEVSEETRTEVQYALGYTSSMGKIRLSQESIANDVKSNPRKYLAISNEDIKDTIKKIWEKIKAFFKKIAEKLGIKKKLAGIKVNNVKKEAENLRSELKTFNPKDTIKPQANLGDKDPVVAKVSEFIKRTPLAYVFDVLDLEELIDNITGLNRKFTEIESLVRKYLDINKQLKSRMSDEGMRLSSDAKKVWKQIGDLIDTPTYRSCDSSLAQNANLLAEPNMIKKYTLLGFSKTEAFFVKTYDEDDVPRDTRNLTYNDIHAFNGNFKKVKLLKTDLNVPSDADIEKFIKDLVTYGEQTTVRNLDGKLNNALKLEIKRDIYPLFDRLTALSSVCDRMSNVSLETLAFQVACIDVKDLITNYMLPSINSIIIAHEVMVDLVRHEMKLLGMK